jgi:hypothetical protein
MVLIDNKIAEIEGQIREAEKIKAMAIDKSDGSSAAEADRISRDLQAGRNQLYSLRNQRNQMAQMARMPQVDPEIQQRARNWAESHSWYDTNLRNSDSRVAKAIEDQLFNEGQYDARNDEYWQELDERLAKYLPHRYNGAEEAGERQPRGPQIMVGGRERPLRKNEVYVNEDRKQAMIAAGAWDDPVLRDKYLKQYQKWDRENRRH